MPAEGAAGREGLAAVGALEGPLASMRSQVAHQVRLLSERRLALLAPVRSLPRVYAYVLDHVSLLCEPALADGAGVRSLARVREPVLAQVAPLRERGSAEAALEASTAIAAAGRVLQAPVRRQVLAPLEHLAALLATQAVGTGHCELRVLRGFFLRVRLRHRVRRQWEVARAGQELEGLAWRQVVASRPCMRWS